MNPLKTLLVAALAALALVAVALPAAAADGPLLQASADPNRPDADESGKRPDPYIAFVLKGVKAGSAYRLIVESSPTARGKIPCNAGLNTQWTPSVHGNVKFALRPVTSGTYFPFAGNEPCRGNYVLQLDQKSKGDWDTIRRFSFAYPSFHVSPLPLG